MCPTNMCPLWAFRGPKYILLGYVDPRGHADQRGDTWSCRDHSHHCEVLCIEPLQGVAEAQGRQPGLVPGLSRAFRLTSGVKGGVELGMQLGRRPYICHLDTPKGC